MADIANSSSLYAKLQQQFHNKLRSLSKKEALENEEISKNNALDADYHAACMRKRQKMLLKQLKKMTKEDKKKKKKGKKKDHEKGKKDKRTKKHKSSKSDSDSPLSSSSDRGKKRSHSRSRSRSPVRSRSASPLESDEESKPNKRKKFQSEREQEDMQKEGDIGKPRGREREKEKYREGARERETTRGGERGKERDKDRDEEREREKEKDRDKERARERDRVANGDTRSKRRDIDRDRSRSRNRNHRKSRSRSRQRSDEKDRDRSKERTRSSVARSNKADDRGGNDDRDRGNRHKSKKRDDKHIKVKEHTKHTEQNGNGEESGEVMGDDDPLKKLHKMDFETMSEEQLARTIKELELREQVLQALMKNMASGEKEKKEMEKAGKILASREAELRAKALNALKNYSKPPSSVITVPAKIPPRSSIASVISVPSKPSSSLSSPPAVASVINLPTKSSPPPPSTSKDEMELRQKALQMLLFQKKKDQKTGKAQEEMVKKEEIDAEEIDKEEVKKEEVKKGVSKKEAEREEAKSETKQNKLPKEHDVKVQEGITKDRQTNEAGHVNGRESPTDRPALGVAAKVEKEIDSAQDTPNSVIKKINIVRGGETFEVDMVVVNALPKTTKKVKLDRSRL